MQRRIGRVALFGVFCLACCGASTASEQTHSVELDAFFAPVDTGVDLPDDKVYPQGRIFPYMGYSGDNAQDAANGFSVGGPHRVKSDYHRNSTPTWSDRRWARTDC